MACATLGSAMRHRKMNLHPALRHIIGVAVAVSWLLGVITCCHVARAETQVLPPPAAAISAVGHAAANYAVAAAGHGAKLTHLCAHKCADLPTAAIQACQAAGLVALMVIVAMAAVIAPFAGPVVAGTRDPPLPVRAINDYLGRNILSRICICRC